MESPCAGIDTNSVLFIEENLTVPATTISRYLSVLFPYLNKVQASQAAVHVDFNLAATRGCSVHFSFIVCIFLPPTTAYMFPGLTCKQYQGERKMIDFIGLECNRDCLTRSLHWEGNYLNFPPYNLTVVNNIRADSNPCLVILFYSGVITLS